jgi:hypothetical protein
VEYAQKLASSYHSVAHRVKYFYCESRQSAGGGMDYRDVTGRCSARLVNELRFRLICDSGAIPMPADELLQRV